jgi:integrase/recombinase XerC
MNGHSPTSTANRRRPEWFAGLLADTGIRKPSAHTMKAYRQDFDAIAVLVAGGGEDLSSLSLAGLTTEALR